MSRKHLQIYFFLKLTQQGTHEGSAGLHLGEIQIAPRTRGEGWGAANVRPERHGVGVPAAACHLPAPRPGRSLVFTDVPCQMGHLVPPCTVFVQGGISPSREGAAWAWKALSAAVVTVGDGLLGC